MTRKERYEYVLNYFREHTGNVSTELQFGSVFQLLVAVVLSAQCTDKRVNQITPEAEVYECVKSVSYPNAKAAHIVAMARELIERFGGEVPACFDSLVSLPGVGRKTANVIMAVAFGEAKMPVDTHVFRVSHRLGLVSKTDNTPLKVERKLVKYIPEQDVAHAHHWLLLHGRYVCTSRAPHCAKCDLADICPKIMEGSKLNA